MADLELLHGGRQRSEINRRICAPFLCESIKRRYSQDMPDKLHAKSEMWDVYNQ
jgi:hypothetical protein